jgi:hypothetical protein
MKLKLLLLASVMSAGAAVAALAQDASQLGTTLTPFGAIKAGSADGAIPAYSGGISAMTNLPAASATTGYPDPFASEQPLFSITSSNMAQYADMLTPGAQALLKRYADYRIDVYPTHRTASYPAWVLANDLKNAGTAQEVGEGDGVTGAYGGVPFPIPKDGYQVMWNSFLSYHPAYCAERFQNYLVDSSGAVTELGTIQTSWAHTYYDPAATGLTNNFWNYYEVRYLSPAAEAGQIFLFEYPFDFTKTDDQTYFYSPGTRRVRLAPEFTYDTPIASYGGAIDYDEIDLFYGKMDKFDWKLVGEKEMIVPYNDYKMAGTTESAVLGGHTLNPDGVRWERHRVWIVDAELKPNARHAFSRWTFYIDEDSWEIVASESYDHAGAVYKVGFSYPYQDYSDGDATNFAHTFGIYDLSRGSYELSYVQTAGNGFYHCTTTLPNMSNYSGQAMAAQAIR